MSKKLSKEEVNAVLESYAWRNKNSRQAAMDAGISQQTASGIIRVFQLMKGGNIADLIAEVSVNEKISVQTVKLVAERIGDEVPDEVVQAISERHHRKAEKYKNMREASKMKIELAEVIPKASAAAPGICKAKLMNDSSAMQAQEPAGNDALYFIRILEELHQQNELLRDLLDVVTPKWVGDLKDNQNANSDVLAGLLREQGQALDAIRCNTRKRGL